MVPVPSWGRLGEEILIFFQNLHECRDEKCKFFQTFHLLHMLFLFAFTLRKTLVPAYPKTQCLAKDDLELLIHLPLPVDWVMCHHTHFRSHWVQNPELLSCSRQASYQRCHTGTPSFILSAMNFSPPVETGPTSIVTLYIFHTRVWSEKGSASLVIWKFWGNYFFNISTFGSHSSKTLERTTFVPHRQPMSCHWWLFA